MGKPANMAASAQVSATGQPPLASRSTIQTPQFAVAFPRPVVPPSAAGRGIRVTDFHLQQPHMLHYNFTVERQLPAGFSITEYVKDMSALYAKYFK